LCQEGNKTMADGSDHLKALVADVAAAYFSNAHVSATEIPQVIGQIAASLAAVGQSSPETVPPATAPEPEVTRVTPAQARRSITPDALISFEDGKPYKTLRRHLAVRGLTPDAYRQKWGLPDDYPLVAPNYSAQRSAMAKHLGLGQKGGRPAAAGRTAARGGGPRRRAAKPAGAG
jgi:predicted transcriptional regulator